MKIIEQDAENITNISFNKDSIYAHIERCGRTCYKSENRITQHSAEKFIKDILINKHYSVLEHGTIYLTVPSYLVGVLCFYSNNPYSRVNYNPTEPFAYITTNYRVIIENDREYDLQYCVTNDKSKFKLRYTFKFTTNRQIANELVRHRVFSFSQESTRFCNYNTNKFNNELTFIRPYYIDVLSIDEPKEEEEIIFVNYCKQVERDYNTLTTIYNAQAGAQILPNCLKTEIVVTGYEDDWKRLLKIRYEGIAGAPHIQMKELMMRIKNVFEK